LSFKVYIIALIDLNRGSIGRFIDRETKKSSSIFFTLIIHRV